MDASAWGDDLDDWVEDLLVRSEVAADGIRLSEAAAEFRATPLGAGLDQFDDDDLADIIEECVSHFEGFGVSGERDHNAEIVDPSNAWVRSTASILHERKLSHRITAADVADRAVPLEAMLGALDADVVGSEPLYDGRGQPLDRFAGGRHALAVPLWVEGFDEGRLIVVWRDGDVLHFDVVDDADLEADGRDELAALTAWFAHGVAHGVGRELTMGVFDLIHHDPSSFTRMTPPIDELLLANGYVGRRGWWGPADQEWQTPGEKSRSSRVNVAAERFGLGNGAQQALARLDDIWRSWSGFYTFNHGDQPQLDVDEIQDLFEIQLVPLAFFEMQGAESMLMAHERRDGFPVEETALSLLADEVSRAAPDSIAALLLDGRRHEIAGRAQAGERAYREVLRRHETNATALVKCMEAAVDASRFDEAARLTQRLMGPGTPNEASLRSYADAAITAGRNEPCPCGSGRKYKQCHQGVPLVAEPYATRALIFKLELFAEAMVLSDQFAPGGLDSLAAEMIGQPEGRDFMIHEGGMVERFLDMRLELLPPVEIERLRSWQMGERGLYEIIKVDPGQGLTLRDVRTSDVTEIVERLGSADAVVGQYVLLRLETVDGVTMSYGQGVLVPASQCAPVLNLLDYADIDEWLEWLADLFAPPRVTTSDGDALVFAKAVVSTSASTSELGALLDKEFGQGWPDGGSIDERRWSVTRDGKPRDGGSVMATMSIVEGCLELSTMSHERHSYFLAELLEVLPDAQLVKESIEPPDMAALASRAAEMIEAPGGLGSDEELSPEARQVLDKHIRKMEANWLHENIPALGGLTPFEALDDPTRRPDLIRLLNSMPSTSNTFDADRLRAALGLDD